MFPFSLERRRLKTRLVGIYRNGSSSMKMWYDLHSSTTETKVLSMGQYMLIYLQLTHVLDINVHTPGFHFKVLEGK